MRTIILLYNDRDRPRLEPIRKALDRQLARHDVETWMAHMDITAFGDIFEQISHHITSASGCVLFMGNSGLGGFQRNIERSAVEVELWKKGMEYGRLLVQLDAAPETPRFLMAWPCIYFDAARSAEDYATAISASFGLN